MWLSMHLRLNFLQLLTSLTFSKFPYPNTLTKFLYLISIFGLRIIGRSRRIATVVHRFVARTSRSCRHRWRWWRHSSEVVACSTEERLAMPVKRRRRRRRSEVQRSFTETIFLRISMIGLAVRVVVVHFRQRSAARSPVVGPKVSNKWKLLFVE